MTVPETTTKTIQGPARNPSAVISRTACKVAQKIESSLFLRMILPGFILYDIGSMFKLIATKAYLKKSAFSTKILPVAQRLLISLSATLAFAAVALILLGMVSTPTGLILMGAFLMSGFGMMGIWKFCDYLDSKENSKMHSIKENSKMPSIKEGENEENTPVTPLKERPDFQKSKFQIPDFQRSKFLLFIDSLLLSPVNQQTSSKKKRKGPHCLSGGTDVASGKLSDLKQAHEETYKKSTHRDLKQHRQDFRTGLGGEPRSDGIPQPVEGAQVSIF